MAAPVILNAYQDGSLLRIVGSDLTCESGPHLMWSGAANGVYTGPCSTEGPGEISTAWPFNGVYGFVYLIVTTADGPSAPFVVVLTAPTAPPDPNAPGNIATIPSYPDSLKEYLMEQYREGV